MYGYQGTQADLFRLMEGLAIKNGLIGNKIPLVKAAWGVHRVAFNPQSTTNFSHNDIQKIYEQFHLLLNRGIIAPGNIPNSPNLPYFHITDYGLKCLKEKEILPYDVDGYLERIENISGITEWVKFYIEEALQCYNANCMEAAVIMLGLSNERIINELNSALLLYLSKYYSTEYEQMENELIKLKRASEKYDCYTKYFKSVKKYIKDLKFRNMLSLMDEIAVKSYTNFTRITRNELSHPSDIKMERIEVLMIFISFVRYCEIQYGFCEYFNNN